MPDNRGGVYKIRNTVTEDIYVGSAHNLRIRWQLHRSELNRNKHHSIILQRAWVKYGADAFVFEVLEFCEPDALFERENHYFATLKPKYNIAQVAESSRRGVKTSDEAKLKMSQIMRGRKKNNDSPPLRVVDKKHVSNTSFSDDEVRAIWALFESGEFTYKQIAELNHVDVKVIWKILNGRSYTWVSRA